MYFAQLLESIGYLVPLHQNVLLHFGRLSINLHEFIYNWTLKECTVSFIKQLAQLSKFLKFFAVLELECSRALKEKADKQIFNNIAFSQFSWACSEEQVLGVVLKLVWNHEKIKYNSFRWLGQNDFGTPQLLCPHLRKGCLCSIALVNRKTSRIT